MCNTTRTFHLVLVIICVAALVGTSGGTANPAHAAPAAATRYVKPSATGTGDCSSWTNACTLQTALGVATSSDEIWVGAGTHKPTTGSDRSATFQLKSSVGVYGGFAMTETLRSQRNWTANVTILSGDIGAAGNSDNSYHVVTGSGTNGTAILDGFTITGGNANGSPDDDLGGGMYNSYGNSTVQNVVFSNNSATTSGGGMHNSHSSPTLTNVTFSGNTAVNGGDGGGMVNTDSSAPTLTNVTFSGNSVTGSNSEGGGMLNIDCSPILLNVTFANNSTTGGYGGAMYNDGVNGPVLTNVTFYSNTAIMDSGQNGGYGGAIYNYATANYTMTHVTFSGNRAVGLDAGHPAYGGAMYTIAGSATARSAIFWGNTPDQIYNDGSTTTVSYSVVQGGYTGTHVITADPLLGAFGNYGGNIQTIPLLPGSSAIDAIQPIGTNDCGTTITSDERGFVRPRFMGCDAGAFESRGFQLINIGGDNQSTRVNTAFALPLQVSVIAAEAGEPVNGGKILFSAPSSGASASLTPNPAIIVNGVVSVTATANITRGAYTVSPWTAAWTSVSFFHLRNTAVFYVKPGASGNCGSWATACELQTALGSAGAADEVWVAAGTYTPTTGSDPNATFVLTNSVSVYGGFAGTETARSQRNWTTHVTTLNGNLSGGAHSLHVVTANGTDSATTLDGFTVPCGQAPGGGGGGVLVTNGSLTIANCRITNNSANFGGGVYQEGASGRVDVTNCWIALNTTSNHGGGLCVVGSAALTNTQVLSNTAAGHGGGLYVDSGRADLIGGMFAANSASLNGGGVDVNHSVTVSGTQFISNTGQNGGGLTQWNAGYTVALTNARFERNSASGMGGGVFVNGGSIDAANVLFAGNQAGGGGAAIRLSGGRLRHVTIAHPTQGSGSAILMTSGTANITDTIIGGYTVGISQTGGTLSADYDLLFTTTPTQTSGGTMNWGSHNLINTNPRFVNPTAGDYHLAAGSPAIDAGTNVGVTTDLDGVARPQGAGFDIGAYEFRCTVYLPLVLRNTQ